MSAFDAPKLRVDLSAIAYNYRLLRDRFRGAECGAVVKANAYGLGVEAIARKLAAQGCQSFFVATLEEGIALRSLLPDKRIAVFHGVGRGEAFAFLNHRLIPCLSSPQQIERWLEVSSSGQDAPSILHVDTGMARLGLTEREWQKIAAEPDITARCQMRLILSHLACASTPDHPSNEAQRTLFDRASALFPELPRSFVNSGGIFLGESFHCDLARPGCSLYGITPNADLPNPMRQVAELSAPILQIRTLDSAQSIGYGATMELPAGSKMATVALGYADGIQRILGGKLKGYVGDVEVPQVARVTMDMLSFDVSQVPEQALALAQQIVIMNDKQTVDDVAAMAGTIGYEIFTRLGRRITREYKDCIA